MKYFNLISICILLHFQSVFAQQISNSRMENWQMMGMIQAPDSFYTFDQIIFIGTATTLQTTDAHTGQYAALIQSQAGAATTNFTGQLTYGNFTIGPPNYFRGWPFASRPTKLKFWYKYVNAGSDTGSAFIGFSKWTGSSNFIGLGSFSVFSNVSTYTLAEVPINYTSGMNPDTIYLGFLSSSNSNPTPGTQLFIDDIFLDYATGISSLDANLGFELFPSISTGAFSIKENFSSKKSTLKVANLMGEIVYSQILEGSSDYSIQTHLQAGVYFVTIENDSKFYCKKILIEPTLKM